MSRRFVPRPDHVKVGHRNYSIEWLEEDQWLNDYGDSRGLTLHAPCRILLLLSYDGDRCGEAVLRETLMHELLHTATNSSMAWVSWEHLTNHSEWNTSEEVLVATMAPPLLMLLKDNPDVVAYLLDDQEHE